MTKLPKATIIIPVYGGASTLPEVFQSLELQADKRRIQEIILIDDTSPDNSYKILKAYQKTSTYKIRIIRHRTNKGLAETYNEGIHEAATDLVIVLHQDIALSAADSITRLLTPFADDSTVLATYPSFVYPLEVWRDNSFWQQALFSRLVGKENARLSGKFDCYRKNPQLLFDHTHYRTAGEDYDLEMRLRQAGRVVHVPLLVTHLQANETHFPVKKYLHKEIQLAEAYGVNLRRYLTRTPLKDVALLVTRPVLVIGSLLPCYGIWKYFLGLTAIYAVLYTKAVFVHRYTDVRILLLPFINVLAMALYSLYFLRGFVTGYQRI